MKTLAGFAYVSHVCFGGTTGSFVVVRYTDCLSHVLRSDLQINRKRSVDVRCQWLHLVYLWEIYISFISMVYPLQTWRVFVSFQSFHEDHMFHRGTNKVSPVVLIASPEPKVSKLSRKG